MNPLELLQTSASERFAWCLLHFVWQGTVLAAIAWVCASGFGRSNARVRYALNVTCLLAMVVCVAVTYVLAAVPGETSFAEASSDRSFAPMPEPGAMPITDMGSELPVLTGAISPPGQTSDLGPDKVAPFSIDSVQWRRYLPYAMVIYWLGVTGMLVRLIIGLQGGQRLRRLSRPVDEEFILKTLAAQACTLGLSYVPAVAYCGRIAVPVVVGVVRPTILLPLALAANLTPEQVEMLLVHELAHIRRLDPLVNVLQRIIEAVLFFHPAVWFVSHRIRIEREHCCDDLVVRAGGRAEAYASSLLAVAQRAIHAPKLPEAMAVVKKTSRLRVRIRRILGLDPADSLRLRHFWLTVPLFVLAGMLIVDSHIQAKELSAPDALAEELAPGFNIYLLKDETLTWDDCNDTPLQDLELQAKPWIRSEDIDRYHASSHCMTLKTPRPFPLNRISLRGTPFVVTVGDRRCYLGAVTARGLLSPFSDDSIPIIYLAGHQSDVVTIVLRGINRPTSPSDVRADRGILAALKDMGVYDVGLSMSLDHVEVVSDINGASITYTYTLTNKGMNPLYVLDPDRMGNELFQRFHRPPFLHNTDLDRGFNRKKLGTVEPDLYTQYDPDWFTLIQPGHPITRTVKVGGYPACPPGKYACALFFHSPGRRFAGDKRTQFDAPVWIGTALGIKRFTMGQDSESILMGRYVTKHDLNTAGRQISIYTFGPNSSRRKIEAAADGSFLIPELSANSEGFIDFSEVAGFLTTIGMPQQYPFLDVDRNRIHFREIPPGVYGGLKVEFVLPCYVRGRILDSDGKPVPGLDVVAQPGAHLCRTDEKGWYSAQVPPHRDTTLEVRIPWSEQTLYQTERFSVREGEVIEKDLTVAVGMARLTNKNPEKETLPFQETSQSRLDRIEGIHLKSRLRMNGLSDALLQYARDHAGTYPESLESLQGLGYDVGDWRGVEYFGDGQGQEGSIPEVIAYDKSCLATNRGTYMLSWAHSVEHVALADLWAMELERPQKLLIEMRILSLPVDSHVIEEFLANDDTQASSPYTVETRLLDEFLHRVEGGEVAGFVINGGCRYGSNERLPYALGRGGNEVPIFRPLRVKTKRMFLELSPSIAQGVLTVRYQGGHLRRRVDHTHTNNEVMGVLKTQGKHSLLAPLGQTSPTEKSYLVLKAQIVGEDGASHSP